MGIACLFSPQKLECANFFLNYLNVYIIVVFILLILGWTPLDLPLIERKEILKESVRKAPLLSSMIMEESVNKSY
jgi:hypothetical protein